jgi:hypothetical protein
MAAALDSPRGEAQVRRFCKAFIKIRQLAIKRM